MCLSIPAEVISVEKDTANVSIGGSVFSIGTQLLDEVKAGDYVLIHSGFAIQRLNKEEADEIYGLLKEMQEKSDNP